MPEPQKRVCPCCHEQLFVAVRDGDHVHCLLCGTVAKVAKDGTMVVVVLGPSTRGSGR